VFIIIKSRFSCIECGLRTSKAP